MRRLRRVVSGLNFLLIALTILLLSLTLPVRAVEERPANFIFLLDVSGSMLYKSEMVTASDGTRVTLFEALRQALKQIVSDHRVLGANSNACIITFGTKVTEKSDWPQQLDSEDKRQKLVNLIDSPDQLQADKHGDTYMGAAIEMALERANRFYQSSNACTTTYVVMLTDGWDEPPPGGTVKVSDAAAKFVARMKEIQAKLGVQTWQTLVIGLQNLPERKAGTTTAKQLATLLNGQFIDVTKQTGGTVSEKIFLSLKQIVEGLKGEIRIDEGAGANGSAIRSGILQFGAVDGDGSASASFPVESRSCYAEQIVAVKEVSGAVDERSGSELLRRFTGGKPRLLCALPPQAISLALSEKSYDIAPQFDEHGKRKRVCELVSVVAHVHNNCPGRAYCWIAQS